MIKIAETKEDFVNCFKVLSPLRPHLDLDGFISCINRMSKNNGYQIAYLEEGGIKAVAGFRISEWLHTGKYLEIEDFITNEEDRSKGYGGKLFDWALNFANEHGCNQVRLVSGISRDRAHNFYLNKGMAFEAKYFSINV